MYAGGLVYEVARHRTQVDLKEPDGVLGQY